MDISSPFDPAGQRGEAFARLPFPLDQPPDIKTVPGFGVDLLPNPIQLIPLAWDVA